MRLPSNQTQWEEYATLVQPKRHWVSRQGEIWRGRGALTTWATFQVVGIELGAKERVTSLAHFAPRLQNFLNLENRVFFVLGSPCFSNVAHDGLGAWFL